MKFSCIGFLQRFEIKGTVRILHIQQPVTYGDLLPLLNVRYGPDSLDVSLEAHRGRPLLVVVTVGHTAVVDPVGGSW